GNQAYGIKAAALTYFGKTDLSKLTLAEAALLAGLPQAPSVLDPTQAENLDSATARRAYVLDQMLDTGTITQEQAEAAKGEAIRVAGPPVATIKAPHFVFQVRNQLTAILGGDEAAVTRGGYKVTTTLDMTKQQIAERVRVLPGERRPPVPRPGHDASSDPRVTQRARGAVPRGVLGHRGHDPDRSRPRDHHGDRSEQGRSLAHAWRAGCPPRRHDERL